jgi:hypothetical protein
MNLSAAEHGADPMAKYEELLSELFESPGHIGDQKIRVDRSVLGGRRALTFYRFVARS